MKAKTVIHLFRMAISAMELLREIRMELKKKNHSDIYRKEYLTEEEAAIYLGSTKNYVKTLMRGNGKGPIIPYYQPSSNNCYISRNDLDRYITRLRHRSADEISAVANYKKR